MYSQHVCLKISFLRHIALKLCLAACYLTCTKQNGIVKIFSSASRIKFTAMSKTKIPGEYYTLLAACQWASAREISFPTGGSAISGQYYLTHRVDFNHTARFSPTNQYLIPGAASVPGITTALVVTLLSTVLYILVHVNYCICAALKSYITILQHTKINLKRRKH